MSAYSPPTRRIPSCSSDYPQCEAEAHTLFPLPSHQIKAQNLSFLKRYRQIFSFRVLKRQILLPFAQKQMKTLSVFAVALHPEGVDRNLVKSMADYVQNKVSPSTRRAWIEIYPIRVLSSDASSSPSTRRAWIEMRNFSTAAGFSSRSPSTRRAWIEIRHDRDLHAHLQQSPSTRRAWIEMSTCTCSPRSCRGSPSTRRAWIEIDRVFFIAFSDQRRPPPGGRG